MLRIGGVSVASGQLWSCALVLEVMLTSPTRAHIREKSGRGSGIAEGIISAIPRIPRLLCSCETQQKSDHDDRDRPDHIVPEKGNVRRAEVDRADRDHSADQANEGAQWLRALDHREEKDAEDRSIEEGAKAVDR